MFSLFTGSYAALEKALVADIQAAKKTAPLEPLLVLSPSAKQLDRLQRKLSENGAYLNIHCLTFYALAECLLRDMPDRKDTVVTEPALFHEIVRELITDPQSPVLLRKTMSLGSRLPKGLCAALSETLRDLRDSGAKVVDHAAVAQEGHLGEETEAAIPILELNARVYDVLRKHHLRTSADLLRRAADRAPEHPWLRTMGGIYLYGFYDLTGVQLDLVRSLAEYHKARIYFPYEPENPAYLYAEKLLKDPALLQKVGEHTSLASGKRNTLSPEVWNCSGPRDEVWLVAKKILGMREKGIAFEKMAVIARQLDSYSPAIKEIFAAHHIPYVSSKGEPIGAYPLAKMTRTLLTLDQNHYLRLSLIDLLKSPYLKQTLSGEKITLWDRLSRFSGIESGWKAWEERLTYWSNHPLPKEFTSKNTTVTHPADFSKLAADFLATLQYLRRLFHPAPDACSWSEHSAWARGVLAQGLALPPEPTLEEHAVWEAIQECLTSLESLDTLGRPVSRERYLKTWEEKIEHVTLKSIRPAHLGVQVLEAQQSRGMAFEGVLVLGLNEKSFPRLIREDPFLSDTARSLLTQVVGARLPKKLDGYEEERLLFELVIRSAEKELVLLYQRSDEEGKPLVPSVYLQPFVGPDRKSEHLSRTFIQKARTFQRVLTPKEVSITLNRNKQPVRALYEKLGDDWDKNYFESLRKTQDALESFIPGITPYDGLIQDKKRRVGLSAHSYSPTGLEKLAECPFQYYARNVLHLHPLEDPQPEGDVAKDALGRLYHKVLETLFRQTQPGEELLDLQTLPARLETACQVCFEEAKDTAWSVYPVAWKAVQQQVRSVLRDYLERDLKECRASGFMPRYFELELEGTIPIAALKGLRFNGKTDRIDLGTGPGKKTARVLDYKSGKVPERKGKIETAIIKGDFLQLPIYLALTQAFLEKELGPIDMTEAALRYIRAREESEKEAVLNGRFWSSPNAATAAENIRGLTDLVKQGHFYIVPDTGEWGHCGRCDFASICRKEHMPSRKRNEQDPTCLANTRLLKRTAE